MSIVKPELHWSIAGLLLILQGLLIWIVLVIGFVAWMFVHVWWQKADFPECLGWYDLNLAAFLQRVVLRPIIAVPTVSWIPVGKMTEVTHRVRPFDLF